MAEAIKFANNNEKDEVDKKEKRFIFNPSEESEKSRRAIQEAFYKTKEKFPECIGLSFFGSLVKGYDNQESDIDLHICLDLTKSLDTEIEAIGYRTKYDAVRYRMPIRYKKKEIETYFKSLLPPERKIHAEFDFVSEDYLDERVKAYLLNFENISATDSLNRELVNLAHLFCLGVGNLEHYRSYLIGKLQETDQAKNGLGTKIWSLIMAELNKLEVISPGKQDRLEKVREGKLPHPDMNEITLDKAEDYFCKRGNVNFAES